MAMVRRDVKCILGNEFGHIAEKKFLNKDLRKKVEGASRNGSTLRIIRCTAAIVGMPM